MERVHAVVEKLENKLQDDQFRWSLYAATAGLTVFFFLASRWIRAYVRLFLLFLTICINSTWGIIISPWAGIETNYHATKAFANLCEWTIGLKIVTEGREHLQSPSVLVYNHQSMLDMIFTGRSMPLRTTVLAKKQLKWLPFLGQYFIFSKAVFIDRTKGKDAIAVLHAAGQQLLAQDASLLVFPEGTRSLSREASLKPFKKGAFHVAIEAGIPVVPIVIENQWKIYRPGVFDSGVCKIRILPPIPTKGLKAKDAGALAESTRETMLQHLKEISAT